jgi:hypothetical protein
MEVGHEFCMKIETITSFNQEYYNNIGHACVESWLKYWPTEYKLTCYVEEFSLQHHPRILQIGFDQLGDSYYKFQTSNEKDRVKTFAKKAYSVIHAMEHSTADRIVWLDADVLTTAKISANFVESLCSDQTLATFMQVYHQKDGREWASAETGVFVLNTRHIEFKNFCQRYRQYYDEHIKTNLRRFYDGEVFGAVANEFSGHVNDLCAGFKKKYKTPLRHTVLGPCLNHYKSKHNKLDYMTQSQ